MSSTDDKNRRTLVFGAVVPESVVPKIKESAVVNSSSPNPSKSGVYSLVAVNQMVSRLEVEQHQLSGVSKSSDGNLRPGDRDTVLVPSQIVITSDETQLSIPVTPGSTLVDVVLPIQKIGSDDPSATIQNQKAMELMTLLRQAVLNLESIQNDESAYEDELLYAIRKDYPLLIRTYPGYYNKLLSVLWIQDVESVRSALFEILANYSGLIVQTDQAAYCFLTIVMFLKTGSVSRVGAPIDDPLSSNKKKGKIDYLTVGLFSLIIALLCILFFYLFCR